MKKAAFILILCLATTATFAQKKSKVDRGNKKSKNAIEYLVIRCIEQSGREMPRVGEEEMRDPRYQEKMTLMMFEEVNYRFNVLGDIRQIGSEVAENVERSSTPSEALTAAGNDGWELESSYAIIQNGVLVHYYNLARER